MPQWSPGCSGHGYPKAVIAVAGTTAGEADQEIAGLASEYERVQKRAADKCECDPERAEEQEIKEVWDRFHASAMARFNTIGRRVSATEPGKCCARGCSSSAKYIAVSDDGVPVPPEFASLQLMPGVQLWNRVCHTDIARLPRSVLCFEAAAHCARLRRVRHCVPWHARANRRAGAAGEMRFAFRS